MNPADTRLVTTLNLDSLKTKIRQFVDEKVAVCLPSAIHVCDGSEAEFDSLTALMEADGLAHRLTKYENCWLTRTDPRDVARVESKTFMCTAEKYETVPHTKDGVQGRLANWMSPEELAVKLGERLPGCMKGRTMYVIPFSMGPMGSHMAKIGIGLSDSPYVAASMRIMTRMGAKVLDILGDGDFVKCLHSVGQPLPAVQPPVSHWPCNPEQTIIAHLPELNEIVSFGSGYGGNSLLDKKCFALRLACILGKREGWLAEHMLISGITNPKGEKKYIAAAFPSCCGKTNMALMTPTLPGWKVECVGDDIAWLKFDERSGQLMAINPENGFFGVAPGTNEHTNPNAMATIKRNTIFTNVAATSDGGVYWEGLEDRLAAMKDVKITSWLGEDWTPGCGKPAAHPNARFCAPCKECPIMDPDWEKPEGVPISAIIFGGRRPQGVPLVYESFDWPHGVFVGSSVSSETTAAAEHKGKSIMHDPFAMRPFFGYNFGKYLDHWLSFGSRAEGKGGSLQLPKIFHVNWFRKSEEKDGKFLWPGFGDNARVVDWMLRRVNGEEDIAEKTAVGWVPKKGSLDLSGLEEEIRWDELFSLPKDFWLNECEELKNYYDDQVGSDLPAVIRAQLDALKARIEKM